MDRLDQLDAWRPAAAAAATSKPRRWTLSRTLSSSVQFAALDTSVEVGETEPVDDEDVEKAAMIKAHGKIAELFYEYDADNSGYLDEYEVVSFCESLGLKFGAEEACQALDEMEMDGTRDGKVSLDEFVNWWNSDTATKKKGSIAGRLAEARDAAFDVKLLRQVSFCKDMGIESLHLMRRAAQRVTFSRGEEVFRASRRPIAEIWVAFFQDLSDNLADRRASRETRCSLLSRASSTCVPRATGWYG